MAEKKEIANSFQKNLYTDSSKLFQPKETYTYALNAINESREGDLLTLTNEEGNEIHLTLPATYRPVGHVVMVNNEVVLFLKNELGNSEIAYYDKHGNYTQLVRATCLNFTTQIDTEYRFLDNCQRIIYFVDGVNPDRSIDIDDILNHPTTHKYLDESGQFDCNKLREIPDLLIPCFSDIKVNNTGGNLEQGSYQIILKYYDDDLNATHSVNFSHQIPIVFGQYEGNYDRIEGGDPDAYPRTTKSIYLKFTNVDTTFSYLGVLVGFTRNNATLYYEVDRISITDDTVEYVLSTLNTDDSINLSFDEVTVSRVPYEISKHNAQIDDRYIKANLKGKDVDFFPLYREASKIGVNYFTTALRAQDSSDSSGSSKTSEHYTDYRSYMRDEIYAFYIVYVWKDGYESPRIPIYGRRKNKRANGGIFPATDNNTHFRKKNNQGVTSTEWDSSTHFESKDSRHLTAIDYEEDTFSGKRLYQRWKVYNTAHKTIGSYVDEPIHKETYSEGELGYYESTYRYPSITNCEGKPIYALYNDDGEVVEDFSGQPIRWHRMPDTTLEPHFKIAEDGTEYILPLGVRFFNVNIPAEYVDDIQGYYIVREKRSDINKTVFDKGIIYNNFWMRLEVNNEIDDYYVQGTTYAMHRFYEGLAEVGFGVGGGRSGVRVPHGFIPHYSGVDVDCGSLDILSSDDSNDIRLDNAVKFLNRDTKSASFHSPITKFRKTSLTPSYIKIEGTLHGVIDNISNPWREGEHKCAENRLNQYLNSVFYNTFNSTVATLDVANIFDFSNRTLTTPLIYIDSGEELVQGLLQKNFINTNQQETTVFETQDDLPEFPSLISTESDLSLATYASLKINNNQMYGQLASGDSFKISSCLRTGSSTREYGGDTFISKFSFFRSSLTKFCMFDDNDNCKRVNPDSDGLKNNDSSKPNNLEKNLVTFYVESEVNTELRHRDFTDLSKLDNDYYPRFNGTIEEFLSIDWNGGEGVPTDTEGAFSPWINKTYARNLYLYNEDYSRENQAKTYAALADNYDFCKKCNEEFPTRIIYSEKSFQEDRVDNYKIFLSLNYRDLPAGNGEISDLFINIDDELYAHTPETLYKVITRPYSVETDQTNVFIGTGEFFSVPPREVVSVDGGYAGSTQKWGTKTTEYGTFFVDDVTGKMFLLSTQGPEELSIKGIRNWSEESVPLNFLDQYKKITGTDYVNNVPALLNGVGYITGYDPRHKRILVTKKDYRILDEDNFDPLTDTDLTDSSKFENLSWTLSYSFLSQGWVSYHSYLPEYYYNDSNSFYTYYRPNDLKSSTVWKHGSRNFQEFYGDRYDHIIEFVNAESPDWTKTFNSLSYISDVSRYDSLTKEWIDIPYETFTHMIAYTTTQSTGKVPLIVKNTADPFVRVTNPSVFVNRAERTWKINDFKDFVVDKDQSLFSRNWTDIQSDFPIDKVPNSNAIGSPNVFQLQDLRDKFIAIRLFYSPSNDRKIVTNLTKTLNNISFR